MYLYILEPEKRWKGREYKGEYKINPYFLEESRVHLNLVSQNI